MPVPRRLLRLCRFHGERAHASQVVGRLSQHEELVNSLQSPKHCLPNPANRLSPAEDLLNAFAFALTDGIAGPARCAPVDGRGHCFAQHVASRCVHGTLRRSRSCRSSCHHLPSRCIGKRRGVRKHFDCCVPLDGAVSLRHLCVHHETVPVISQEIWPRLVYGQFDERRFQAASFC